MLYPDNHLQIFAVGGALGSAERPLLRGTGPANRAAAPAARAR